MAKINGKKKGFTMIELIATVIIIGIVAAFALPNYAKAVRKADERDALIQLTALRAAALIYKAQAGQSPSISLTDIASINSTFHINLVSKDGTAYSFSSSGGSQFLAQAKTAANCTIIIRSEDLGNNNPCYYDCLLSSTNNCQ
ncbi:MAG: type II secretion system protein [Candidatus Omnitrophica bacterium]|nr:type II secretion system protein [Candidatus Omnitrophota bacterium]